MNVFVKWPLGGVHVELSVSSRTQRRISNFTFCFLLTAVCTEASGLPVPGSAKSSENRSGGDGDMTLMGKEDTDTPTLGSDQLTQEATESMRQREMPTTKLPAFRVRKVSSDSVTIQSDHGGPEKLPPDTSGGPGRVVPVIDAVATWTVPEMSEFKARMREDKTGVLTVGRGEVVTVRVPTHPKGMSVCWEFATDTYDIGFGVYFEWTPVTNTAITVLVSESSEDEDEEEEAEVATVPGDIERGTKQASKSDLEEILPVYRKDSHTEVHAGRHKYPGQGVYLLKFDNSYSIWRNKTLYYQIHYSS
uniref:Protein TMED8 n=1 Tax=Callorhinchus milii TaxID=7868 RepID=V9KVD8_CALMI